MLVLRTPDDPIVALLVDPAELRMLYEACEMMARLEKRVEWRSEIEEFADKLR